MSEKTYCVNFTMQHVEGTKSPIFESDKLRQSQHAFCEVHNHQELGEVAAKAVWIEMRAERLLRQ